MRRLFLLLFLLLASPAFATGLLDNRPSATLGAASLSNTADFLPVHEAFKLSLIQADAQTIKLRFVATDGYYLYRHRFQFRTEPADVALGTPVIPKGEAKHDEFFGDVEVYHGVLDIELPRTDSRAFTLLVGYQGCADKGLCYPPETERLSIDGEGGTRSAAPATGTSSPPCARAASPRRWRAAGAAPAPARWAATGVSGVAAYASEAPLNPTQAIRPAALLKMGIEVLSLQRKLSYKWPRPSQE